MSYPKPKVALEKAIGDALRDPDMQGFVREANLKEASLKEWLVARDEEIWNAMGSEIEAYNKIDNDLEMARSSIQKHLMTSLDDAIKRSRKFDSYIFGRAARLGVMLAILFLRRFFLSEELPFLRATAAALSFIVFLSTAIYLGEWFTGESLTKFWLFSRLPGIEFISDSNVFQNSKQVGFVALALRALLLLRNRYSSRMRNRLQVNYRINELERELRDARNKIEADLLVRGVLPALRSIVNNNLVVSFETKLPAMEARGLGEIHDSLFEVSTEPRKKLLRIFETMEGGSIGVAGPRGAGKTTVMRSFCDERAWQLNGRTVLSIMTPAPAQYEARDFILHLFSVVCRRVCELRGVNVDQIIWTNNGGDFRGTGFIDTLRRPSLIIGGIGIYAVVVGFTIGLLKWTTSTNSNRQLSSIQSFFDALGITGGPLVAIGVLCIILGTVPALMFRSGASRRRVLERLRGPLIDFFSLVNGAKDELLTQSLRWLRSIKFQQSYTSGWSGALKFPIGIEGALKSDASLSERPMSLPEIVYAFRMVLRSAAKEYRVIIGIDELDKIHPDSAAEHFLNDIKVIFGIEGVHYLLSVSENVLASFERRGIPVRNAFDSCFDEIVQIGYLSLSGANSLLRRRVIGMPYPFICFCYCLSGGLPRDLIRSCRNLLMTSQSEVGLTEIGPLSRVILQNDLRKKLEAAETAAAEIALPIEISKFIAELSVMKDALPAINLKTAKSLTKHVGVKVTKTSAVRELYDKLNRLRGEVGVYAQYVGRLSAFFERSTLDSSDFIGDDADRFFNEMVSIRQAFAEGSLDAKFLADEISNISH